MQAHKKLVILLLPAVATRSTRPCSYKAVESGEVTAEGLPEGVRLKRPGGYGVSTLKEIISAREFIKFHGMFGISIQQEKSRERKECLMSCEELHVGSY